MKAAERNDLIISWLTISLAFALVFSGTILSFKIMDFVSAFPIALVAVGTGFIFHELAHRYVAIKFGAHAKYKAWSAGLIFAIVMALVTGFVFAAPGAVYIYGPHLSRKKNGLISLAGPAANIVIGLGFLALSKIVTASGFIGDVIFYAYAINFFLAAFNLLPINPLDGSKVFAWDPKIWAIFFLPLVFAIFFL
jgi:Zn-dependent protease